MPRPSARKRAPRNRQLPVAAPWTERLSWEALALFLLVALAYGNSLNGSFHFDDSLALNDHAIVGPGFGWANFRVAQTRPLTCLTFHWNYLAGGLHPWGYHAVNLALHAVNILLVLVVARRHLSPATAWLAAALFAIHPLQTESVDYVWARSTLLATTFALVSLLFFFQKRYGWSVVAFAVSLLAKEEPMALPAFFLLYDLAIRKRRPREIYGWYLAFGVVAALFAARVFYALHLFPQPSAGFSLRGVSALSYLLTETRVVWIYLRLFLLPVGLDLDHALPLSQGLLSPPATLAASLALVAVIVALAQRAWRGEQAAVWGLGFLILLLPTTSIVPVADAMFEHRTYLPLICLVIVAAGLLARLPAATRRAVAAALLVALLGATVLRNRVWHDEQSLWTDVLSKSPRDARAYFNLAAAFLMKDPARSRQLSEQGLQIQPTNAVGQGNLGLALLMERDPAGALVHLERASALGLEVPTVWDGIAAARLRLGQQDLARSAFQHSLEINPCDYPTRVRLIELLRFLGKTQEAAPVAQLPPGCRPTREQSAQLEEYRRSLH